ncbi:MAG: hypothetical protein HRT72_09125 [Flavobacteriales bacterium]|nr:hypothetical protein [Flavobacteriales bacterium]
MEHFITNEDDVITYTNVLIEGKQDKSRGYYTNFKIGDQAEIDLISSIKSRDQLTLFGSSEFNQSNYCSYHYLPDSVGIPTLGIGHGYHQHFSILCELLAAHDYLENSKISIFISPGWFQTKGTNSEAFIEFVRPNFLSRILENPNIDRELKIEVGKYIYNHEKDYGQISHSMAYLKQIYLDDLPTISIAGLNSYLSENIYKTPYKLQKVTYKTELKTISEWNNTRAKNQSLQQVQEKFLSSVTSNKIYVNDDYYNKYILRKNGTHKVGKVKDVDIANNRELEDFRMVVKLLTSKSVNCSFVIQPLNPYYYENIDNLGSLMLELTKELDRNKIPYLNLFVSSKEEYEPGTLKDIMHLGNYGWMKINKFLEKEYYDR